MMMTNGQKIRRAADETDKLWEKFERARLSLGVFHVNGAGVLTDRGLVRRSMVEARQVLDAAIRQMDEFKDWPSHEDYED